MSGERIYHKSQSKSKYNKTEFSEEEELNRNMIKDTIASITGIPNTKNWEIIDQIPDKGLYMIHYTKTADLKLYGQLRGVVIDIINKQIVCRSYAHSPIAVYDELKLTDNELIIHDENGTIHTINKNNLRIKRGYEGVLIRIFKHDDVIYFSTHKKINAVKSRWGNGVTFIQMYNELVVLDPYDMFGPEPSSPVVQLFILVHPDVQIVSKIDLIEGGFSIYLGGKLVREVEDEKKYEEYFNIDSLISEREESISLTEANKFLSHGHYPKIKLEEDKRLNPGEFVIVQDIQNKEINDMIVVHSTPYNWRSFVRNNDSNICLQFYNLFNFLGSKALNDRFPKINFYSENYIKNIIDKRPLIMWPSKQTEEAKPLYRIWACLLLSMPLNKQDLAFNMLKNYQKDKKDLKDYLASLLDYEDIERKDISEDTKAFVLDIKKNNYSLNEDLHTSMIKEINFRVDRMKGLFLYRMIKNMKCSLDNLEPCE